MDLDDLSRAMFADGGLKSGDWDIGFVVTDWLPMAIGDGHLADLTEAADALPPEGAPDCWPPCLRDQQRVDGRLWGLPYHDGPAMPDLPCGPVRGLGRPFRRGPWARSYGAADVG